jgi:large subunit ribosomal protein L18
VKITRRDRRRRILRKRIAGTVRKPRLSVFRSVNHLHAQLIDDTTGRTLAALSTTSPDMRGRLKKDSGNVKGAAALGEAIALLCKTKGITNVVFDRGGYLYHGRIKALAEAARKAGLVF